MSVLKVISGKNPSPFVALIIMSVAAFLTRLLPLSISQFPFNNDSLTEIGIANEILASGHLTFSPEAHWSITHSIATPALDIMLAFFASALGTTPALSGQALGAAVSISTIGALFLLGRQFSGDNMGGIAAALMGVMFGTFVFSTGSIWKVMLGLNFLFLVVFYYVHRGTPKYRALTITMLFVIPFVHHLVAVVTFLLFSYLLAWSWFFGVSKRNLTRRHVYDLLTIAVPGVAAALYYAYVELDRLVQYSSPEAVLLLFVGFSLLSLIAILVLSMNVHSKWSFAPILGGSLIAIVFLDYFGYLFPYDPSASEAYLLMGLVTGLLVALAWYGAEVLLETKPLYRAVEVGLLIAPLTIIGFGLAQGFSLPAHQILYRSFDLLDFFLFLGVGVGIVALRAKHPRMYPLVGALMVVSLAVSFPFAYESDQLLGVRHDTQAYEVDTLTWLDHRDSLVIVISDERLAYVARNTISVDADPSLPQFVGTPNGFPEYHWYYVIEDSWTTDGVNNYPNGRFVLDAGFYEKTLDASNVCYIGGPQDDHIYVFLTSYRGGYAIFPNNT